MEDKNFSGYFDQISKSNDEKQIKQLSTQVIEVLVASEHELKLNLDSTQNIKSYFGEKVFRDLDYTLGKLLGGLQSADILIQRNYGLLLGLVLERFQQNVNLNKVFDQVQFKLDKKQAFSKTEMKQFTLGRQIFYTTFIEFTGEQEILQKILSNLFQDLSNDPVFAESTVLSIQNMINLHHQQKWIFKSVDQEIKMKLKDVNPPILSILINLQHQHQQKNVRFQWDKYLQDKVLNKDTLKQYIFKQLHVYHKKTTFYEAIIQYMVQFQNDKNYAEVMKEFFDYFVVLALKSENSDTQEKEKKSTAPQQYKIIYVLLNLLNQFFKQSSANFTNDLTAIMNKPLIEIWYKAMSNVNKNLKNTALKLEKNISKRIKIAQESQKSFIYNFLLFTRSIYGYRFNPKSRLAAAYTLFSEKEVGSFYKQLKKLTTQATDPQQRLHYLNEIYVLADVSLPLIVDTTFPQILFYIYEQGFFDKTELFYSHLTEEIQQLNDLGETKQKAQEQTQSFYYSLLAKLFKVPEETLSASLQNTIIYLYNEAQQVESLQVDLIKLKKLSRKTHKILDSLDDDDKKTNLIYLLYAVEFFSIINQDEGLDIMGEFYNVVEDYSKNGQLNSGEEPRVSKKLKKSQPEKDNKWIKVLVELMIQLLTKSTQFLREAVNKCFKVFVDQMDSDCFGILADVLVRDNADFIEDMEDNEMTELGNLVGQGVEEEDEQLQSEGEEQQDDDEIDQETQDQ